MLTNEYYLFLITYLLQVVSLKTKNQYPDSKPQPKQVFVMQENLFVCLFEFKSFA